MREPRHLLDKRLARAGRLRADEPAYPSRHHDQLAKALAELGYVSVPEELLESDYEGPSALEHFAAQPTGWTRFFGTVW